MLENPTRAVSLREVGLSLFCVQNQTIGSNHVCVCIQFQTKSDLKRRRIVTQNIKDAFANINWDDPENWIPSGRNILNELHCNRALLRKMLDAVVSDDELFDLSEINGPFDKIVLFDDGRSRLRLHKWRTVEDELIHDHRYDFVSVVLHGSYRHRLYSSFDVEVASSDTPSQLAAEAAKPIPDFKMVQPQVAFETVVKTGDIYAITHTMPHVTLVEEGTVSLVLRGPARKRYSGVANISEATRFVGMGAKDETQTMKNEKVMNEIYFGTVADSLKSAGVL